MSDTFIINPRATLGDNQPDPAQAVADRLARDYVDTFLETDRLGDEAGQMPELVTSDDTALRLGAMIKRMKDHDATLESFREAEKLPFLRGGNAVDNTFFVQRDKLARRRKGDRSVKPGWIDILQARIDNWQAQKRAAEIARLNEERREAERLAAAEQARLRKLQEEAQEAERALARARSEASKAQRAAEAAEAARKQAQAQAEADMAREQAEEARRATLVMDADIVRTRSQDNGVMLTSRQEGYAILIDRSLINMNTLAPYFTDNEIEKALRGWAKANGHKVAMPGAEIGFRQRGITR